MICNHKDIDYSLVQTNRKTMSIYVEPDGSVTVRAPNSVDVSKINKIIDMKSYWIYKSIAELEELNKGKVSRSVVNGEGFLFMGKSYRLKIDSNLSTPLSLLQGYFSIGEQHIPRAREVFINFYKEKGKQHLQGRIENFSKKLGVTPGAIRVMELKNRWASRSKTGVNFHWKVMLAPMTVIDYIIVHELAHFQQKDHSPKFWEIVGSVMPNYAEKRDWLKYNGATLDV